jgi:glutamyl-tRNA synthetase
MENRKVRVRFAPSPTGPLHIGGVRTALYNYLFAKKHGGDFILRIEDTDQERLVPGAEQYIIESLKWCGIEPNEGFGFGDGDCAPYRQSDRKNAGVYAQYAQQLIDNGHAYYAFDTKEELDEVRAQFISRKETFSYNGATRMMLKNSLALPEAEVKQRLANNEAYVVRFKFPENEEIHLDDLIRGHVVMHTSQLDDKVLFKSDGMPTYHLANVVDDYLMKITHVIRGEEWLSSAPLHVMLYRSLGWENVMPQFSHLPLLLKPNGNGKLSKRDGDKLGFPVFPLDWTNPETGKISSGFREKGYLPDALVNFLALLGWHPSGDQELFTMEELINDFSLERVNKAGAKFDIRKARWFNQQYLHTKTDESLVPVFKIDLERHNITASEERILKAVSLLKVKSNFVLELTPEQIERDAAAKAAAIAEEKAKAEKEGKIYEHKEEKEEPRLSFWEVGSFLFIEPAGYDADVIKKRWNEQSAAFIAAVKTAFENHTDWQAASLETLFKDTAAATGTNPGSVMQLFRVCLSGSSGGPALFEMAEFLGKETCVRRLAHALNTIGK